MTNERDTERSARFRLTMLPWLIGGAVLILYLLTLGRGLTLSNFAQVPTLSGWNWRPVVYAPATYFVTSPLRALPAALIPCAVNFFAPVCAAFSLVILARSVAWLPHDRTHHQRDRLPPGVRLLGIRTGWMPVVL